METLTMTRGGGLFIRTKILILIVMLIVALSIAVIVLATYFRSPEDNEGAAAADTATTRPIKYTKIEKDEDVRLTDHVVPINYTVTLRPLFNKEYDIEGRVSIRIKCRRPTSKINLNMFNIKVHETEVVDMDDKQLKIRKVEVDKEKELFWVYLLKPVQKGNMYTINIKFTAKQSDELTGIYRSTYAKDGENRTLATTQFQVTGARRAFPCFDEPGFKAKFKTSIGRMKNMTSISNMNIEETVEDAHNKDWVWDHYAETVNMSTYLLALIVSDFEQKKFETSADWELSFHGKKSSLDAGEADYSGTIAVNILRYYENFYKIAYPLPKLDMAAVPDFDFWGMENWGLIIYKESAIYYKAGVTSASFKEWVAHVVAHELAHQWFGNLVTPQWWTDLWLNEGFASYVQFLGVNQVEPNWKALDSIVVKKLQPVLLIDSLRSSHPISIPVKHPDEIDSIFDIISYEKGSSIIRMMDFFLTPDTFRKGLTNYLNAFAYSNAIQDDLWHHLTEAAHEDGTLKREMTVKDIMDTWTLQMGYPVVTVTRDYETNSAVVSQSRFLLDPSSNSSDTREYRWWIPISFTNKDEADFDKTKPEYWISKKKKQITIQNIASKDAWSIFNIRQTGYYRVNYDKTNWNLIGKQLSSKFNMIIPIQRAQILDDALNLARAGELDYSIALPLLQYLPKETHYFPLDAAFRGLQYIDSMLKKTPDYRVFKKFMRSLIDPLYENMDWNTLKNLEASNMDITQIYKNVSIIEKACYYEHTDCVAQAEEMFKSFQQNYKDDDPDNTNNQIAADLKSTVYCTAIKHGGEQQWNFLFKHYKLTSVASEKETIIEALGCTNKIWLLSNFLNKVLKETGEIRAQDAVVVLKNVPKHTAGGYVAWDFAQSHWSDFAKLYGDHLDTLRQFVQSVAGNFNTQLHLEQLISFRDTYKKELRAAKRVTEQAIEKTRASIKWMKNQKNQLLSWMKNNI